MVKLKKAGVLILSTVTALGLLSGCGDSSSSKKTESTTVEYIDYKGETRSAAADPGMAETTAGKGYQHTLFDSADNKCQHCHNELYDTWKTSMHAKSWSDPIFQSKYQDFLRMHITKIGADKSSAGGTEYTETTFGKVAKTCMKCHAPAAIYSGDVSITLTAAQESVSDMNSSEWSALKSSLESNLAGTATYDSNQPTTVTALATNGKLYTATYHIGNAHNREGINCATCHKIETVRLMSANGADGGEYTLAGSMRGNVIGPVISGLAAGDTIVYNPDASNAQMNAFFKHVGPEMYSDPSATPKSTEEYDVGKTADGRFTMTSIDLNGTDGKVHYTGGPFYGPFGVTGLSNSNTNDETNRTAQVHPGYDKDTNNHFGNHGKALCLSCHQRSAGALVPGTSDTFMELCTTWSATSNGSDNNYEDTATSPKCQRCHMPRLADKRVLHKWADPENLWTQADMHLTPHFDPEDTTTDNTNNPVKGEWLNDHAFVGANPKGASNFKAKLQSGFDSTLSAVANGTDVTVTTTLNNKTAHMFPGAHPMRRVLTRVIVTDAQGNTQTIASVTGNTSFSDITNNVVTGDGSTIDTTGESSVTVEYDATRTLSYQGMDSDLNGSAVTSQKFDGNTYTITAADGTVSSQMISGGKIKGTVKNAAIVESSDATNFTRIYGRETGKNYDTDGDGTADTFIVRPGFDSNTVPDGRDNRLQPNETESYTLTLNGLAAGDYTVTYKVYYLPKGAGGSFPAGSDGWLDSTVNAEKKLMIQEAASHTATVTVQ